MATPYAGTLCGCTTEGPDGFDDLLVKFETPEFLWTLSSGSFKEERTLTLTGFLNDGTPIEGSDCVVIVGAPKGIDGTDEPEGDSGFVPLSLIVRTEGSRQHLEYVLPEPAPVSLTVYDVSGRIVDRLVQSFESAGSHSVDWDSSSCPSGVYFYRLESGQQAVTKKVVLVQQ